jgi:hypothetical protein
MKEIPFAEFIVNVFAVLRSVEQTREAILLPPSGKPLAEIRSVPTSAAERERLRAERDARDLKLTNRYADALNEDALDSLEPSRRPARRARKKKGRKRQ